MRLHHEFLGLLALGAIAGRVAAQSVELTSFLFHRSPAACDCGTPASGPLTVMPTDPNKTNEAPVGDSQAFAQAPAAGGEAGLSFNPAMFGDLGAGGYGRVLIRSFTVIPPMTITIPGPPSEYGPTTITKTIPGSILERTATIQVPLIGAGAFKISDNESPRPTDRVFFTYNYFDRASAGGTTFGLNRELIGFENTFLDGNASFGLRLPFLQTTLGSDIGGFANHEIGDMTLIGKFAFINDDVTGNVLSAGLALTVPTADHSLTLADGSTLRSVLFQPYAGWIINGNGLYVQGFHSLVVPTDSRDVTELNTDVGMGYWLYKSPASFLRGIVPTFEGHLFTPLTHSNNADLIYAPNIFTLTAGVNLVMPGFSTLGMAVATPVTGPRPDSVEAIVSLNLRF